MEDRWFLMSINMSYVYALKIKSTEDSWHPHKEEVVSEWHLLLHGSQVSSIGGGRSELYNMGDGIAVYWRRVEAEHVLYATGKGDGMKRRIEDLIKIEQWTTYEFKNVNFKIKQLLTGLEYVRAYIYKMGKVRYPACLYGDSIHNDARCTSFVGRAETRNAKLYCGDNGT